MITVANETNSPFKTVNFSKLPLHATVHSINTITPVMILTHDEL